MEREVRRNIDQPIPRIKDFEVTLGNLFPETPVWSKRRPVVDVRESRDMYVIELELPGCGVEDVEISIQKNILTVNTPCRQVCSSSRFLVKERDSEGFSRSFTLPVDADCRGISVDGRNGVLVLVIPRS